MKNLDRALWAVDCMTPRAKQSKKLAQFVIKNQTFTSIDVKEATGIEFKNISRILGNLENSYGFVFTREMTSGRYTFQLVNCKFDGERKPRNIREIPKPEIKAPGEKWIPIKKPVYSNPLWALALNMSI